MVIHQQKINPVSQQHVIDSLFGFSATLGIKNNLTSWDIPIAEKERNSAKNY